MTDTSGPAEAAKADRHGAPALRAVAVADLRAALASAAADMRAAPAFGLLFAGVWVAGGWGMAAVTWLTGQSYWLVFAAIGFPMLAPFAAVGLYEVSRRRAQGHPLDWARILSVVWREKDGQIPWLSAIIIVVFLFWFFLAHMIFALFLGLSTMTNVSTSWGIYATPEGLTMLVVGTVVGAAFSTLLYAITVLAIPMLLDREVDFVTAMITSLQFVAAHPVVMLGWGGTIALVTVLSLLPGFLGLFLTLPVFGHATWHLYARLSRAT